MRLVKVSVPRGEGSEIAQIAFDCGISEVSQSLETACSKDGFEESQDVISARAATPVAKRYLDALQHSRWGQQAGCTITVRQPLSIHSSSSLRELTRPFGIPLQDLRCELWQFSHVTPSFVGRIVCAALLLAHGLAEDHLLNILGGLLFLPLLPCLMAVALGLLCRDWPLCRHGLHAWLTALLLIAVCSAGYGWCLQPFVRHQETASWSTCMALSGVVGVAAALGEIDDAGKRELIGLAAASQLALLPAWAALAGATGALPLSQAVAKFASVFLNAGTLLATAMLTYWWADAGCLPRRSEPES
ncbi:MAG: hypothetical protein KF760_33750 [Candidatus Eremiobacteraeota bacterium]|nr:hypothetical protein [Candidatus Eremiobacteraeota bacterium]MCW5869867.1 hypothetical protein [Candidatus Eremiobacteraeota bacterium]